MKKIEYEKLLNIKTTREVDVIVVGGGCAGLSAAISSAREGKKVLLVEKNSFLGGMATAGLVGPFMTCYDPDGNKQVIKGLFEEFVEKMVEKNGAIHPSKIEAGTSFTGYRVYGHSHCGPFNAETYKMVAESMCEDYGVELLYNSIVIDVCLNGSRIEGLVVATKNGLILITAKIYIDCSGDADVAYKSGVPYEYGDENGNTQPASMFFVIKGIDKKKLETIKNETGDFKSIFYQNIISKEIEEGRYSVPREKVALYENPDGTYRVNMSRIYVDNACDPFELTKATIEGRKQIPEIIDMMKRLIPGCENIELVESASILGLRETRRIIGEYLLTWQDISNKKKFDDCIFVSGNSVDMHKGTIGEYIQAKGEPFQIPYRIIVPQKITNLLVAGRCCSADRKVLSAIRVMPPVFAMGQAAGVAASLAIENNVVPKNIDIKTLQSKLKKAGVIIP